MQSRLCIITRELLRNRSRLVTYEAIGKETGLSVEWIADLAQERFKDPGVSKVEILYEYLSGKRLEV